MIRPAFVSRTFLALLLLVGGHGLTRSFAADESKPIDAVAARGKVGEKVRVQLQIRTAKDPLEKRGEIYLDSELDFRDPKNFAIVITRDGARSLKEKGVDDIVGRFQDKTVVVDGMVSVKDETPRIEVNDAEQIRIVENP